MLSCVQMCVCTWLAMGVCYLECTVGGPVVYMGRDKDGANKTKNGVPVGFVVSCLDS